MTRGHIKYIIGSTVHSDKVAGTIGAARRIAKDMAHKVYLRGVGSYAVIEKCKVEDRPLLGTKVYERWEGTGQGARKVK